MGRPEVIKQSLLMVIVTFLAMMIVILWRVAVVPNSFETSVAADMPLGRLIDGITGGFIPLTYFIGIIIAFINASLLTGIILRYSVSVVRTYLPMIIYAMIAFGVCVPVGSLSAFFASLILILSSASMIAAFRRSYQFGNVFKSAFFLGILPMMYAPSVVLVLIIPVTLILYQRTFREWIVALTGFCLPFLLCSVGWWIAGESFGYIWETMAADIFAGSASMSVTDVFLNSELLVKIVVAIYVLLAVYSIFLILFRLAGMRTRARKIYLHFIWLLILCIAMIFLPSSNIISIGLIAVPASVVISAFFIKRSGWITVAVYVFLLLMMFLMNLFPLFR